MDGPAHRNAPPFQLVILGPPIPSPIPDLYDLLWYLSDPDWPSPNLTLLNNALRQTGWQGRPVSEDTWRGVVRTRLAAAAWGQAVADVRPFLEPSADPALLTRKNLERLLATRRA